MAEGQTRARKSPETEQGKTASEGLPADAKAPGDPDTAAVQEEVAQRLRDEWDAGVRGTPPDPTPNENYTVAGVTDDSKHVPEEFKTQTGVTVYPDVHDDAKK